MSTKDENIPAPSRTAARLTVHTPRRPIISMSTSGLDDARSLRTQAAVKSAAATISPSTRVEPQPHAEPSLTASNRQTSHADSRTAPDQLTAPDVLTGDSGTKKCVETIATTMPARGNQKSQW